MVRHSPHIDRHRRSGRLGPKIDDQVTTFSFEFYEPLPDSTTGTNPGMTIGYYYNPSRPARGCNRTSTAAAESIFRFAQRAFVAGLLGRRRGAATAYEREKVNTIFMVANDSAAAVENYRDSRTVDPGQADVWISLAGADPTFAFSVSNPKSESGRVLRRRRLPYLHQRHRGFPHR